MFKTNELTFKNKMNIGSMTIVKFAHGNNEVSAIVKNNKISEIAYYEAETERDYIITKSPKGFKSLVQNNL